MFNSQKIKDLETQIQILKFQVSNLNSILFINPPNKSIVLENINNKLNEILKYLNISVVICPEKMIVEKRDTKVEGNL